VGPALAAVARPIAGQRPSTCQRNSWPPPRKMRGANGSPQGGTARRHAAGL